MTIDKYNNIVARLGEIIKGTKFEGHLYTVGGCNRDKLLGREIKDIDVVLDIPNGGIEFAKWLMSAGYTTGEPVVYEHFGTSMFRLRDFPEDEIEAVQTRKECYRDINTRNPDTAFGTIQDDATRRDFTYNAIYCDVSTGEMRDVNGKSLEDLNNNILRTCGSPDIIFNEDPLRILRLIRFACYYDSDVEENTLKGATTFSPRLEIISKERVQTELNKILLSDHACKGINMLYTTGAYRNVFPSWGKINEEKKNHICHCLEHYNTFKDLIGSLAVLLYTMKDSVDSLYDLKYPLDTIYGVKFVLENLDMVKKYKDMPFSKNLRKIQYKCKTQEIFHRLVFVYNAVTDDVTTTALAIKADERLVDDADDMYGYKLPINGDDIMELLGIEPGRKVKEILDALIENAYLDPSVSKRECIKFVKNGWGK